MDMLDPLDPVSPLNPTSPISMLHDDLAENQHDRTDTFLLDHTPSKAEKICVAIVWLSLLGMVLGMVWLLTFLW